MAKYELELGEQVINLTCECCNKPVKRVWGYVSKDGFAHAVYYALLAGHEDDDRRVGHTVSIGVWGSDDLRAPEHRQWCHIHARNMDDSFQLRVGEPDESNFYPWKIGGKPLTRAEVMASPLREDFYEVLDFVNVEDPAVNSYLLGEEVSIKGRVCKHEDGTEDDGGQGLLRD